MPSGSDWLSPQERAREAHLHVPKRLLDWRLGRWTAKHALALRLGGAPEAFEVRVSPGGAPEAWHADTPLDCGLSISHSGGRAVAALAERAAVGCDLEMIEPRSAAFLEDYLTAGEHAFLAEAAPERAVVLATLFWSAKESVMKAVGEGLRIAPAAIVVSADPERAGGGEGWHPFLARWAGASFHGFSRQDGARVLTLVTCPASDHHPRLLA